VTSGSGWGDACTYVRIEPPRCAVLEAQDADELLGDGIIVSLENDGIGGLVGRGAMFTKRRSRKSIAKSQAGCGGTGVTASISN